MMDYLIAWLERVWRFGTIFRCSHIWKDCGVTVEGATLSWSADGVRQVGFSYICHKCGKEKYEGGFIIHGDKALNPGRYNADGWPIDENGKQLAICD